MPAARYELNPITRITAGAVGPAGRRVFYIQARQADLLVTLLVEKEQVQALAIGVEQFLQDLQQRLPNLLEASADIVASEMELEEPIDPAFRVGQLGLGYDEETDRMILVARETQEEGADPEEASVARFWATRSQLRAMSRWGLDVASKGRPICGNCGQPIDPEGHFCPKRNGHKH